MPRALPKDLLRNLARRRRLAICLNYDGTIAPITANPEEALPSAEIRDLIVRLAQSPRRIRMAIASGRRANEVRALVAYDGPIAIIGVHGLEAVDWNGCRRFTSPVAHCANALDKARLWLGTIAGSRRGFFVEDKGIGCALHYRSASWDEAASVTAQLRMLIEREAPELEMLQGHLVIEIVPRVAPDKGFAFLSLIERDPGIRFTPVYFSDDPQDEGAFYKLRRYGVTVLVGEERQSCAEYRLASREEIVEVLAGVAAEVTRPSAR